MSSAAPFAVNVLPPSPEASALAKYADVPINLYTGAPLITIPLYDVRERDLQVPVFLSYHGSGHKVEDEAPRVGLGWALNAGGLVTRSIRGLPDEYGPGGFLHQAAIAGNVGKYLTGTDEERFQAFDAMARGCLCAEPDVYYFNFASYSGKFQFDWDGSIHIASATKLRITPIGLNPSNDSFIQGWEIITPDGIRWVFDVKETTSSRFDALGILQNPCVAIVDKKEPPHTWHLAEVSSPFTNSSVRFEYTEYFQTTERWSVETQIHNEHLAPASPNKEKLTSVTKGKYLSRLFTSSGDTTIDFLPGAERTDVKDSALKTLGAIRVTNRLGEVVKHWELAYHYDVGRLGLQSVQELGGAEKQPPFRFDYYSGKLPGVLSHQQDHWGFYNDNPAQTLIPATVAERSSGPVPLDGANRAPAPKKLTIGMLKQITYPTGGKDTFEFEPHEYSFEQDRQLKEESIIDKRLEGHVPPDSESPPGLYNDEKEFVLQKMTDLKLSFFVNSNIIFGGGTLGFGSVIVQHSDGELVAHLSLGITDSIFKTLHNVRAGTYKFVVTAKVPPASIGRISAAATLEWEEGTGTFKTRRQQGGGVRISKIVRQFGFGGPEKVTRYLYTMQKDGEEISAGSLLESNYIYDQWMNCITNSSGFVNIIEPRFFRYSQNRSALGTTHGSHVGYSQVTVIHGADGENGRTLYKFTSAIDLPANFFSDQRPTKVPFAPATSFDYRRGLLKEQIDFPAASDTPVRRVVNGYTFPFHSIDGLKVGWEIPRIGGLQGAGGGITGAGHLHRYAFQKYPNIVGYARLVNRQSHLHGGTDPFVIETAYEFHEGGHKQLSRERRVTSEGMFLTEYKYASDYPAGTDAAIDELVSRHVADALIESVTFRADGLVISARRNRYALFDGRARPSQVETASIDEPFKAEHPRFDAVASLYESRHVFRAYDFNGNLLEQSEPGGMVTCYIWDRAGTQLLAKVDNATRGQVFYENFEDTLEATTTEQAYTGTRSKFVTGAYSLDPSQLPQLPGDYTFSYWQKIGQKPWSRVEKRISGYVPGTPISTDPIGGFLDEVRLYPSAAHITSFTHKPLRGLQTRSDLNDLPTFYEYDGFGRLSFVLDHDRYVRTHYEYVFPESDGVKPVLPGHVRTYTALTGGLEAVEEVKNADHHAVAQSTDYVDGFARTIQKVRRRASPGTRDVVEIVEYDPFGRKAIRYLPFTAEDDSGEFKTPEPSSHPLFAFYSSEDETVAKTGAPFAVTLFDGSSLDRVVEQGAPGEAWQPRENPADSHTLRFEYRPNAAEDEILHWRVSADGVVADAFYSSGELRAELTLDEHNTRHAVFYDRRDREILRATRAQKGEEFRTYLIYDEKSNLAFIIPPRAVGQLPPGEAQPTSPKKLDPGSLKADCYRYQHDHRNRLVEQAAPGTEMTFLVYDRWDRLVLSQTGNQRVNQLWTYHKFDALDRLVLSGEFKMLGGRREIAQTMDEFYASDPSGERRFEVAGNHQGYSNRSFPLLDASATIDHVIYYDDYRFISGLPDPGRFVFTEGLESGTHLPTAIGQLTGERLRVIGTDRYISKAVYYGKEYRPVQVVSDNHLGGFTLHSQTYTFTGKPHQTLFVHHHDGEVTRVLQDHTYDHAQRLTRVHHQVNDQQRIMLYAQTFNDLGQVVSKGLHSGDDATFAQLVDYRYNIRGWLTSINRLPIPGSGDDKRLFALEQFYETPSESLGNVPQFNGNPSAATWMNAHFLEKQSYIYDYDPFNRLASARYRADGNKDGAYDLAGTDSPTIRYDANGNILSLTRHGFVETKRVAIDRLNYSYRANQLTRVEDASGRSEGFVDAGVAGDAYEYDANGNLVSDRNKQIQVTYNYRNLVDHIVTATGESVRFGFDAVDGKCFRDLLAPDGSSKLRSITPATVFSRTVFCGS